MLLYFLFPHSFYLSIFLLSLCLCFTLWINFSLSISFFPPLHLFHLLTQLLFPLFPTSILTLLLTSLLLLNIVFFPNYLYYWIWHINKCKLLLFLLTSHFQRKYSSKQEYYYIFFKFKVSFCFEFLKLIMRRNSVLNIWVESKCFIADN